MISDQPLVFDRFHDHAALGRFVLVEKYHIAGGGIISATLDLTPADDFRHECNQRLVFPTAGRITPDERSRRNGHAANVLWLTGLPGSGKTTLAEKVEEEMFRQGYQVYVLDGDNLRMGLTRDLGFSAADRKENVRRIAEVAKLFADAGILVLVSLISPYQEDRDFARSLFKPGTFIEVYVKCSVEVCEKRDIKGLYKKARNNEIRQFTGVSDVYEPPESAEIIVETDKLTPDLCAEVLVQWIAAAK